MTNPELDFWPEAPDLTRDNVGFGFRGNDYLGHLVAGPADRDPRPLVLVVHNYQGLKQFDIDVAEYMARLGYTGLAVDLYGNTVPADEREFPSDPAKVADFQKKCFEGMVSIDYDFEKFRSLMQEWIDHALVHPSVDEGIAPAVIGYCFGGMAVIECIRGGLPISGGVSFHGLLQTGEDPNAAAYGADRPPLRPCRNQYNTDAVLLIENGAEDTLVPAESRQRFTREMDDAGVDWNFHDYAATPHGFALPPRIGPPGRLFERADRRSTQNMLALFREIFPGVEQSRVDHNAAGTRIP